jgi:cob(I)alamin adenosyltransferase
MSITTKAGDDGCTELLSGERVGKDHPRIEACGAVDELSSHLGFARLAVRLGESAQALEALQRDLARAGAEIASIGSVYTDPINDGDEKALTEKIAALEDTIQLKGLVLLGRTEGSARLDIGRAVARRLERRVLAIARVAGDDASASSFVSDALRRYLNRLSDYLFLLARAEEAAEGKIEYI